MFFKGSRYGKVPICTLVTSTGREIRYTSTRYIPDTPAVVGHRVRRGERLDNIAHQHYRDSQRFWRICDANVAMWPDDLLEEAAIIRIPPSEG